MSVTTTIVTPIIQAVIYALLIIGILWAFLKMVKAINPDIRWTFKYKIFRRSYKEEDVAFCLEVIEVDGGELELRRKSLLKYGKVRKANELFYIFRQIQKEVKGGSE